MRKLFGFLAIIIVLALLLAAGLYYRDQLRYARQHAYKFVPKAEKTIKITEGWTDQEIADYLATIGPWTSADFIKAAGITPTAATGTSAIASNYDFLSDKPARASLQGYLFPDTYRVYASSTVTDIITKMLDNFGQKLTPQRRADIEAQGKTIYEILTMASIVEKEAPINYQTNDDKDARIISGIFWHRLKIGQPLQSDATLSYALGDNKTQHNTVDLAVDSPYNTYKYAGLPPGPIGNPGLLAIEAAIYPIATDYNYFLTPPGSKTVIYARTYAEHLRNKAKYLP